MKRQAGFTILEVLVGFLVAALLLSVILSAFSDGMRSFVQADRLSQASLVAQSRLAELGHSAPLQPGNYQGRDAAGYSWQVAIAPLSWSFESELQGHQRILYQVNVKVSWQGAAGRESSYEISSMRLAQLL